MCVCVCVLVCVRECVHKYICMCSAIAIDVGMHRRGKIKKKPWLLKGRFIIMNSTTTTIIHIIIAFVVFYPYSSKRDPY